MAKQAVVYEVKTLTMSCDKVGNLLLVKYAFKNGQVATLFIPAHIVFWLLKHLPVNQDPNLEAPPPPPEVYPNEWDDRVTPRVNAINCTQFAASIRMKFELEGRPELLMLLDRGNVELMRQFMENYRPDLMDLGIF